MTAAQAEAEWIDWAGGECPVPGETEVDIQYRAEAQPWKGDRIEGPIWADLLSWFHDGEDDDIIAYRVVVSQ